MLKLNDHENPDYDLTDFVKDWANERKEKFLEYIKSSETVRALHVEGRPYEFGNVKVMQMLGEEAMISMEKNLTALISNNYKVMIYIGNLDWYVGIDTILGMLENPGI